VILNKIFDTILESTYDVNSFNQVLEISLNSLKESENAQPYLKAKALFTKMIKRNMFIYTDLLTVVGSLNYNIFTSLMNNFKSEMILTSLFYGNIETSTLERIKTLLVSRIPISSNLKFDVDNLHEQKEITGSFIFRTTNDLQSELNGIIENFYQIGYRDLRRSIATSVMELCWGNLFYYQLRTMQQLGYIVASTKNVYDSVMVN
jgi:secreted Zn-dependent insulinase-like peptidase